jgi:hypothetical protein
MLIVEARKQERGECRCHSGNDKRRRASHADIIDSRGADYASSQAVF